MFDINLVELRYKTYYGLLCRIPLFYRLRLSLIGSIKSPSNLVVQVEEAVVTSYNAFPTFGGGRKCIFGDSKTFLRGVEIILGGAGESFKPCSS